VCIPLLPLVLWLVLLPRMGALQYDDYYGVVHRVSYDSAWSTNPARWLEIRSNEHHVPLPALLYFANWLSFDGDNRSLAVLVVAILAVSILALRQMQPASLRHLPFAGAAVGFLAAAILAGPGAAAQVIKSFAGSMWLLADALALAALAWAARRRSLWPVLLLGAGAALSYSSSLALWPALLVTLLAGRRSWKHVAAVAGVGAAAVAVWAATYVRPVYHPRLETHHPGVLVDYLLRFVGAPLSGDPRMAAALGVAALLAVAFMTGLVLARGGSSYRAASPWWGVQVYVLGNGIMAAVARSGFGLDQAMAPRYLPLQSLFVISVLCLAFALAFEVTPRWPRRTIVAAVAAVGAVMVVSAAARGRPSLELLLDHAAQQPAAAWALREGVWEPDLVKVAFCPWPKAVRPVMPFLRRIGHAPFDRPPDGELGAVLDIPGRPTKEVRGTLDRVARHDAEWVRVEGWAFARRRTVREVVIVDEAGVIRGKGFVGFPRRDVARAVSPDARLAGFVGFARAEPGERLRAVARVDGLTGIAPLNLERVVP